MMQLSRAFVSILPRNILRSFWGRNLLWHILAICATVVLVSSDFDWTYFKMTRPVAGYLFFAVFIGSGMPVLFPIGSYIVGLAGKDRRAVYSACSAAQAALIALFISSLYKAFTGRPGPMHSVSTLIDTSRVFRFGCLRGGIFWGWPSSHTTVAFAMALSVWTMYPRSKVTRLAALLYAFYIGLGVSMTIHWFSDFVAGSIIGTVIGTTVGKSFKAVFDADSEYPWNDRRRKTVLS